MNEKMVLVEDIALVEGPNELNIGLKAVAPTPVTEILRPNGVGDETRICAEKPYGAVHWTVVDDVVANDDVNHLYHYYGNWARDLYRLPAPTGFGIINFIEIYLRSSSDYGYPRIKPSLKSGGVVIDGTEFIAATFPNWSTHSQRWVNNPVTGQPWERADIAALQIGVSLRGTYPGYAARCTQVYVEVNHTPYS